MNRSTTDHILEDCADLLAAQHAEIAAQDARARKAWARERRARWFDLVLFSQVFLAWTLLTLLALVAVRAGQFLVALTWLPLGSLWLILAAIWRNLFAAARESLTWEKN